MGGRSGDGIDDRPGQGGEEVARDVSAMGVDLPYPQARWYGEPPEEIRREFLHQATLMKLDARTPSSSSEPLSTRLWRRYGAAALGLLEAIRQDPSQAEPLQPGVPDVMNTV